MLGLRWSTDGAHEVAGLHLLPFRFKSQICHEVQHCGCPGVFGCAQVLAEERDTLRDEVAAKDY